MKNHNFKFVFETNINALKLIHKWCKLLIPSITLHSLFHNLTSYITLYMSAKILNELAKSRDAEQLRMLVIITISIDFLVILAGELFNKLKKYEWKSFEHCEEQMFIEHGFNLDYAHLENPKVQNARRKIDESKFINNFGIWSTLYTIESLSTNICKIILSFFFSYSLIILVLKRSIDLSITLVFIFVVVFALSLSTYISMKNAVILSKKGEERTNKMIFLNRVGNAFSSANYQMGKDVRIYGMKGIYNKYQQLSFDQYKMENRIYWFFHRNIQIPELIISQFLSFAIYAFTCINAIRGVFGIGDVIKYIGFISMSVEAAKGLINNIANIKMNAPFLSHYLSFFKIENEMTCGTLFLEKNIEKEYIIEFKNVSFKYPGSKHYALRNLNLEIRVGQSMAVVGMNGSGKTTMIKLLCRLYDPTEGEVKLNGINIKEYNYDEYMCIFSVVFQDFKLFSFTLGQNLTVCTKFNENDVMENLRITGFSEFVSNLPHKLNTFLYKDFDESGVEISGGEAQKISLSRALHKNSPFIILDEPTSALDPISEYEIYSNFNELIGGKAAIFISHRLSSCRFCDDIAVFHEGCLIQKGNHLTLINDENGLYFKLWNAQSQHYLT